MALTIRKVAAQRAEINQNIIKRQFLYNFNRNCLYLLSWKFMSRALFIAKINALVALVSSNAATIAINITIIIILNTLLFTI